MRLRFQTKVLLPVVLVMALLVAAPLWLVTQRMGATLEATAAENLRANNAVFQSLMSVRARDRLLRYRNVPNEPRFKAVLKLSDPKTLHFLLAELSEELGVDAILFYQQAQVPAAMVAGDVQFAADEFSRRAEPSIRRALTNEAVADILNVGARPYDALFIPAVVGEDVVGTLAFVDELNDATTREFTQLTRSQVVLLAGPAVATSSLHSPNLARELEQPQADLALRPTGSAPMGKLVANGEHFTYIVGHLGTGAASSRIGYILLSSYEEPLQALQETERTFLWIQLLGIVAGTTVVYGLVRRVTQPLRDLREMVEAVGQGDFSRQVRVQSRDECGELATVFNQMTVNLRSSRAELQRTVDSLRSTQAQLIQSEKLRAVGTLAGGIAHDFNNILGAILGFAELALDDVAPESRTARNVHQILKAGQRARGVVRQILAFSRQSEPESACLRLSPLVDETMKLLRATLPPNVELRTICRTSADWVVADPSQLHQVLMNLGTNAGHALRNRTGCFTFTVEEFTIGPVPSADLPNLPPGCYLRLLAADTGHGMDRATLERIFEPFFTTKPVGEGTGLGLSVVHGIIKHHGGDITVSSEPGVGTTFHIYLPQARAPADAEPAIDRCPLTGRGCLLVVDDEEPLVNVMEQKLGRLGYETVGCRDSDDALRKFRAAPARFAAVITDQNMPGLTGEELAREISRVRPDLPIILCSGSGNVVARARMLQPIVCACVLKPVDFSELSRVLRRVINILPAPVHREP